MNPSLISRIFGVGFESRFESGCGAISFGNGLRARDAGKRFCLSESTGDRFRLDESESTGDISSSARCARGDLPRGELPRGDLPAKGDETCTARCTRCEKRVRIAKSNER